MCVHTAKYCEDGNKCNGVFVCEEASGTCIIDKPVVDCDDNNACTVDSCIASTGLCHRTDKICNDANVCTANDYCDVDVGCVFTPVAPPCCGNAQCESNENAGTCPQDCSTSITTDLAGANYGYLVSSNSIRKCWMHPLY